jgi:hypothetical protein
MEVLGNRLVEAYVHGKRELGKAEIGVPFAVHS